MGVRVTFESRPSRPRFASTAGGSITLEFVILLPFLLGVMLGLVEFYNAWRAKTRFEKIGFVINDIMSRHDVVDEVDIAYLVELRDRMLPVTVAGAWLRISSVCFEADAYRVMWSVADGPDAAGGRSLVPLADGASLPAPMPRLDGQDSVVVTEVGGRWRSRLGGVTVTSIEFDSVQVGRPRFVRMIPHAAINASNLCPAD